MQRTREVVTPRYASRYRPLRTVTPPGVDLALPKNLPIREIARQLTEAIAAKRTTQIDSGRTPLDSNTASFHGWNLHELP